MKGSKSSPETRESPWYQDLFRRSLKLTEDQNEKHRFENDHSGCRIASSVGGSNTGEGGDRIVCDVPHNVQEGESEVIRKNACDWWDRVTPVPQTNQRNQIACACGLATDHTSDGAGD